jgi:hypothetical protein
MRRTRQRGAGHRADDVRHGGAARGCFNAEIAVLEKRTQTALEPRVACVADGKTLRGHHSFPSNAVAERRVPPS